jgi:hypothetical protein
MGREWIKIIKKANRAFSQQEYSQASGLFTQVLAETRRNLRQVIILSRKNINAVQEFALCSRVAANALLKNGQVREAERIYHIANEALKPLISNLNNPLPYRALVLSEFKLLFYGLADLYVSNEQVDRLNAHVKKNQALLIKWAEERQMMSQCGKNLN